MLNLLLSENNTLPQKDLFPTNVHLDQLEMFFRLMAESLRLLLELGQ